jgi:hypothetical protein
MCIARWGSYRLNFCNSIAVEGDIFPLATCILHSTGTQSSVSVRMRVILTEMFVIFFDH